MLDRSATELKIGSLKSSSKPDEYLKPSLAQTIIKNRASLIWISLERDLIVLNFVFDFRKSIPRKFVLLHRFEIEKVGFLSMILNSSVDDSACRYTSMFNKEEEYTDESYVIVYTRIDSLASVYPCCVKCIILHFGIKH